MSNVLKLNKPSEAAAAVPSVRDDPEYREQEARLESLREQVKALQAEIIREQRRRSGVELDRRSQLAEAMALGIAPPAPPELPDIGRMHEQEQTVRMAVTLAERRLNRIRSDVSARIAEEVRPRYLVTVKKLHTAALALLAAVEAEEAWGVRFDEAEIVTGAVGRGALVGVDSTRLRWAIEALEADMLNAHGVALGKGGGRDAG